MKKNLMIIAAIAALVFNSCAGGDKKTEGEATEEGAEIEAMAEEGDVTDVAKLGEDLNAALESSDGTGLQGKIDAAKEYAQQLLAEGKGEQAKAVIEKVQEFLSTNAEKVTSVIGDNQYVQGALDWVKSVDAGELIDKAGDIVGAGSEEATETAAAVKEAAADKVEAVKEAAADKVEAVKEAAADKVEAVKEAKDQAIEKGNEAIEAAKENVKEKVKEAANDAVEEGLNKVGNLLK